jgi:phosphomannomutase
MGSPNFRFRHDGWRAKIADGFDFDAVSRATRAFAATLLRGRNGDRARVVVGFDRRFLADEFAMAAAETLTRAGIDAWLCRRPLPTPALSRAVVDSGASGGVMVSASGSPATIGGLILRGANGGAARLGFLRDVEAAANEGIEPRSAEAGRITDIDPIDDYLAYLGRHVDVGRIRAAGLSIAFDPMFGVTAGMMSQLLEGDDTKCVEIHSQINPLFPGLSGPTPTEDNLARLRQVVVTGAVNLGLAFDGDGDRLALIDEQGKVIDSHHLFALLARYELELERNKGLVLKTVDSSRMIDVLANHAGAPLFETAGSFSALSNVMVEQDAVIAGDAQGGFAVRRHLPERDALLAALLICSYVVRADSLVGELVESLHEITGPLVVQRLEVEIDAGATKRFASDVESEDWPGALNGREVVHVGTTEGAKLTLENGDWALVRVFGDGIAAEIVAESEDSESAARLLDATRDWLLR